MRKDLFFEEKRILMNSLILISRSEGRSEKQNKIKNKKERQKKMTLDGD